MELLPGPTIGQFIKDETWSNLMEAKQFVQKVINILQATAQGLQALAKAGVYLADFHLWNAIVMDPTDLNLNRIGLVDFSRVWLPTIAQGNNDFLFAKVISFPEWSLGDDDPCDYAKPTEATAVRLLDGTIRAIERKENCPSSLKALQLTLRDLIGQQPTCSLSTLSDLLSGYRF